MGDMEHVEETRVEDHVAGSGIRAVRSLKSIVGEQWNHTVHVNSTIPSMWRPRLPSDMWQVVCSHLPLHALPRLRRVCKASQHGLAMLLLTNTALAASFDRMLLGME